MGAVIEYHPKLLDRLADVYLKVLREQGPVEADEYVNRTLTPELVEKLVPIIRKKSVRK